MSQPKGKGERLDLDDVTVGPPLPARSRPGVKVEPKRYVPPRPARPLAISSEKVQASKNNITEMIRPKDPSPKEVVQSEYEYSPEQYADLITKHERPKDSSPLWTKSNNYYLKKSVEDMNDLDRKLQGKKAFKTLRSALSDFKNSVVKFFGAVIGGNKDKIVEEMKKVEESSIVVKKEAKKLEKEAKKLEKKELKERKKDAKEFGKNVKKELAEGLKKISEKSTTPFIPFIEVQEDKTVLEKIKGVGEYVSNLCTRIAERFTGPKQSEESKKSQIEVAKNAQGAGFISVVDEIKQNNTNASSEKSGQEEDEDSQKMTLS